MVGTRSTVRRSEGSEISGTVDLGNAAPKNNKMKLHQAMEHIADPGVLNYANEKPGDLLDKFWAFAPPKLSGTAAMLVSSGGEEVAAANTTGELLVLVREAAGLQKAHGRNITREDVANDMGIEVPSGYTPTFDLYLQTVGIKSATDEDRKVDKTIKAAIRAKLTSLRQSE